MDVEVRVARSADMLQWGPAEKAIHAALETVEAMPPDYRLSTASAYLVQAKIMVSAYLDDLPGNAFVAQG